MTRIKKLPPHEAQKIAAGEVVDRPANVVKELLENAIDAQATQITLHIEDGGKKLIRIIDDGCGMTPEDTHLCFQHHATSKITTVSDLDTIATFGFRGEALSSISSVSKVTLSTQTQESDSGTLLELEQATITNEQTISRKPGTDISIKDLFYNVPARKKFLKKNETEWRHIVQLFYAFCLSYRSIHFILYSDGKKINNCPPVEKIADRAAQLWGHNTTQHMLTLPKAHVKDFTLDGAISNHTYSRFDRSMIFLFVNNRWIKNIHLSRALLRGYTNVLQPAQYPTAFIFINIDPQEVDINIHPRKEEVKFLHPRIVEMALQDIIKKRLQEAITQQLSKTQVQPTPSNYLQKTDTTTYNTAVTPPQKKYDSITFNFKQPVFTEPQNYKSNSPEIKNTIPQNNATIPTTINQPTPETTQSYNIIGQYKKTYILLEQEDGLFMVDQHAAHERILYEQFSKRFEDIATTKLLFPQIIKLNNSDLNIVTDYLSLFKKNGIELEPFGSDQLIIHATPVTLKNVSLEDLIKETLGWAIEYKNLEQKELHKKINEKIHAKMACSAAVKAGDTLTMHQMQKLISDLEKTENNLTCPHGRPTGWLFPIDEIKKKFKRDYRAQQKKAAQD